MNVCSNGIHQSVHIDLEPFEKRQMEGGGGRGVSLRWGWGVQTTSHLIQSNTYVLLSVKHEAAVELRELAEGHVTVPHLRVLGRGGVLELQDKTSR